MLPKFPWSRHLIIWPPCRAAIHSWENWTSLGLYGSYPKHRQQQDNLMCWEEGGGDLTSVQWGGPVWGGKLALWGSGTGSCKRTRAGTSQAHKQLQEELQVPWAGQGIGPARFRKHSYCIPTVPPRHSHECPSSASGQACLGLSTQLPPVRPGANNAPLSLSEDLCMKKAVDRFCGLQCGLFSGLCLLLPPLCFIREFRISILCFATDMDRAVYLGRLDIKYYTFLWSLPCFVLYHQLHRYNRCRETCYLSASLKFYGKNTALSWSSFLID